jgi:hypothetical protein
MKIGIISQIRAEGYEAGFRDARDWRAQCDQLAFDEEREIGRHNGLKECASGHSWLFASGMAFGLLVGLVL